MTDRFAPGNSPIIEAIGAAVLRAAVETAEQFAAVVQDELKHAEGQTQSAKELREAFRRAAQLRDTPMHWRRVRGRKNRVYRNVLTTAIVEHKRRLCLVPYTQVEIDGRRVTQMPRNRQPASTPWPKLFHQQWIREDRLEAIPDAR